MNLEQLKEYVRITVISLNQDLEGMNEQMEAIDPESDEFKDLDIEYTYISGQIAGMNHILHVAQEK